MKILHLESIKKLNQGTVLALGYFDGIHIGHQKILKLAVKIARQENLTSALFTFKSHSLELFKPDIIFPYLTTFKEKIDIARHLGLDYFIDVNFTKEFAKISAVDFIDKILLKKLRGKVFVVGEDYRFGYKAGGNVENLKEIAEISGARVEVINDIILKNNKISSTAIRKAILKGDIEKANSSLGRWYSIEGKVQEGRKIGRKLGVPTANLEVPTNKVAPRQGVYCVFSLIDNKIYYGVGHLGSNPTFNHDHYKLEIHLFDFNKDLYDKNIRVFFVKFIRRTFKFPDAASMIEQIKKDIAICYDFHSKTSEDEIAKNVCLYK